MRCGITTFYEEVIRLSLSNQHLLEPVSNIQQIVKDLCGIQAQYFNNSIHALKLRYKGELNQQCFIDLVKTWTVRGTLHLISKDDWNIFISALETDWFNRWGKYLEKYFSSYERNQWQTEIYELIKSGIINRDNMVSYFTRNNI
ncbi:MAG: hypothetical protein KAX49_02495 [Halanaerobiales bacterium]|nr:hypothetical protein [Halanaerobiales bacterium]